MDWLKDSLIQHITQTDVPMVRDASSLAEEEHQNQYRDSGEPYIYHSYRVAACYQRAVPNDSEGVAVCLIHDVIEDVLRTSLRNIETFFGLRYGKGIAYMVSALSKLPRDRFGSRGERVKEYYNRLFDASHRIKSIPMIKLCDRLDNVRTLDSLKPSRAMRILKETSEVLMPFFRSYALPWTGILERICQEKLATITSSVVNDGM